MTREINEKEYFDSSMLLFNSYIEKEKSIEDIISTYVAPTKLASLQNVISSIDKKVVHEAQFGNIGIRILVEKNINKVALFYYSSPTHRIVLENQDPCLANNSVCAFQGTIENLKNMIDEVVDICAQKDNLIECFKPNMAATALGIL